MVSLVGWDSFIANLRILFFYMVIYMENIVVTFIMREESIITIRNL